MIKFVWNRIKLLILFGALFLVVWCLLPFVIPSIPKAGLDVVIFSAIILLAMSILAIDAVKDYKKGKRD